MPIITHIGNSHAMPRGLHAATVPILLKHTPIGLVLHRMEERVLPLFLVTEQELRLSWKAR